MGKSSLPEKAQAIATQIKNGDLDSAKADSARTVNENPFSVDAINLGIKADKQIADRKAEDDRDEQRRLKANGALDNDAPRTLAEIYEQQNIAILQAAFSGSTAKAISLIQNATAAQLNTTFTHNVTLQHANGSPVTLQSKGQTFGENLIRNSTYIPYAEEQLDAFINNPNAIISNTMFYVAQEAGNIAAGNKIFNKYQEQNNNVVILDILKNAEAKSDAKQFLQDILRLNPNSYSFKLVGDLKSFTSEKFISTPSQGR
jgi:hypothetical protein